MSYRLVVEEVERLIKGSEQRVREQIIHLYGDRGKRALRLVDRGRVLMVLTGDNDVLWIVKGRRADYLVIPRIFCSCNGYIYGVSRGLPRPCYHLIAQAFAEKFGLYRVVEFEEPASRIIKKYLWRKV